MDSLQNILGGKDFTPPTELELIQDYIQRRYGSRCKVIVQRDTVVICVPSSSLASTLRLEQIHLIEACKIDKRLVIRIGY